MSGLTKKCDWVN